MTDTHYSLPGPRQPEADHGLHLPWVDTTADRGQSLGERLLGPWQQVSARAATVGSSVRRTAVDAAGRLRPAQLPLGRRTVAAHGGERSTAPGFWDARRGVMIGCMVVGTVLLVVSPGLRPESAPATDPAAAGSAAGPEGTGPAGSRGRPHPPASAAAPASDSPSPSASDSPSAAASPSPQTPTATAPATTAAPRTTAPAPPAATLPPAGPAPFRAVAGFGCAGPGGHFKEVGAFSEGAGGWNTVNSGGYAGDSCDGRFEAVPMSGDRNKDDPSFYAQWTFDVGTTTAACTVAVYVPTSSSVKQVGGAPAYYTVGAGSGGDLGSFTVDQIGNRGSWVDAGSFAARNGTLTVKLHNRGLDFTGSGQKTYAHLAAAQIRVDCPR
ncbi:hypothetical protein AB0K43_26640 [Kitasatospora sp. NPDC049258]|uniref:hypothetical protein n=1 Tax=Kitasatospora sp. NPDC049258 TaxID=3155394 RepID=UPI0034390DBE